MTPTAEPRSALVEPTAEDPIPDVLENALSGSYVSPTYWLTGPVNAVLGLVGARNPIDLISEQLAGDWTTVQKAGQAARNLADFNELYGNAMRDASDTVLKTWHGVAATASDTYFTKLADGITDQRGELIELGTKVKNMATGMYEGSQAIKGALAIATDYAILAVISWAAAQAASAASATGVGAAIAAAEWAATIAAALKVLDAINDIISHINYLYQTVTAMVGLIASHASMLKSVDLPKLPGAAYDNPEV